MNKLMKMRQERTGLIEEAEAMLATAEREGRELNADEEARYNGIRADVDRIDGKIDQEEWRREQRKSIEVGEEARYQGSDGIKARDRIEDDPKRGFTHMADFGRSVKGAVVGGGPIDDRLLYAAPPGETHRETGSEEGYMVPPQFRQEIWQLVMESEGLFAQMNPEPTNSNTVQYIKDESTPWGSSGVQAYWRSELQKMDPSRLATQAANLSVNQLYAFTAASEELLADTALLNSRLTVGASGAINWKLDQAVVFGDGVGKPLGAVAGNAHVVQAKEDDQAADTVVPMNVTRMYTRLRPDGIANSFWLCRPEMLAEFVSFTIGDSPVWLPPNGFQGAPGGTLYGRPVFFSEHAEAVGDEGDLILMSPTGYLAVNRTGGIDFASSIHLWFDYAAEAFRWTFRAGGTPILSAPVQPAKGNVTSAYAVTLAARD